MSEGEKIQFPDIPKVLKTMFLKDQQLREEAMRTGFLSSEAEMIDLDHQNKLKTIIEEIGWPTYSKVGKEASGWAWMIVQHADKDLDFQKECLGLMNELSDTEVNPINRAYLEDRVRLNEGRPLFYGTQIPNKDGAPLEYPIEDLPHLDKRRANLGLEPYEEYRNNFLEYVRNSRNRAG